MIRHSVKLYSCTDVESMCFSLCFCVVEAEGELKDMTRLSRLSESSSSSSSSDSSSSDSSSSDSCDSDSG